MFIVNRKNRFDILSWHVVNSICILVHNNKCYIHIKSRDERPGVGGLQSKTARRIPNLNSKLLLLALAGAI
jgi:hypothetical protein